MKKIYTLLSTLLLTSAVVAQAPTLVKDINDGANGSNPKDLFVFDNQLFFIADDASGVNSGGTDTGIEPWKTDGTAANTSIILDINTGDGNSSNPFNVFTFNDKLYFTANDGAGEIWTSDLTAAGTTKVDIIPSVSGESPLNATVVGSLVYLTGLVNGNVNQIIQWDGVNDAILAPDSNTGAEINCSGLGEFDGKLYSYMLYSANDVGRELYVYENGTYSLVKDIAAGTASSGISNFTVANGTLYFEATDGLWQTDGTEAGTIEVPAATTLAMGGVNSLYNFNGNLLFEGDNGAGDQLWILNTTSGLITQISTNAGTNSNHDPSDYTTIGNLVYYRGESSNSTDGFLFRTDGISTVQLDDTIKDVDDVTFYNDLIYFEGEDLNATLGNELYVFNPATASFSRVERNSIKMYPNPSSNGIINFTGNVDANSSFKINDLSGRMVLKGTLQNSQLQHNLNSGVYFISLENLDNAFKLVVE